MNKMDMAESSADEDENAKLKYIEISSTICPEKKTRTNFLFGFSITTFFIFVLSGIYLLDIELIPAERLADLSSGIENPKTTLHQNISGILEEYSSDKPHIEDISFLTHVVTEKIARERMDEFIRFSTISKEKCFNFVTSKDWSVVKTTSEGDTISSMVVSTGNGKIFKITSILDMDASSLINWIYEDMETSTSWNKQIILSKILYTIDENTGLIYQESAPLANGAISPRDVVVMRHRGQYGPYFVGTAKSIDNLVPVRNDVVRSENDFCCYAARKLENHIQNKTELNFLINTHMKGWIPKTFINMFMPIGLAEFMESLKREVRKIKDD